MNWSEIKALYKKLGGMTTVQVTDLPDTLIVRSTTRRSVLKAALMVTFTVVWTVLCVRDGGGWLFLAFGVYALGHFLWHWWPGVDVQLKIDSEYLEPSGIFGEGYVPTRSWVRWSSVSRLEYGRGMGGGDEDYSPEGMWAVGPHLSICLLPGLSEEEVTGLVSRIYRRFPDRVMAEDDGYQGFLQNDLITLNLSGRG